MAENGSQNSMTNQGASHFDDAFGISESKYPLSQQTEPEEIFDDEDRRDIEENFDYNQSLKSSDSYDAQGQLDDISSSLGSEVPHGRQKGMAMSPGMIAPFAAPDADKVKNKMAPLANYKGAPKTPQKTSPGSSPHSILHTPLPSSSPQKRLRKQTASPHSDKSNSVKDIFSTKTLDPQNMTQEGKGLALINRNKKPNSLSSAALLGGGSKLPKGRGLKSKKSPLQGLLGSSQNQSGKSDNKEDSLSPLSMFSASHKPETPGSFAATLTSSRRPTGAARKMVLGSMVAAFTLFLVIVISVISVVSTVDQDTRNNTAVGGVIAAAGSEEEQLIQAEAERQRQEAEQSSQSQKNTRDSLSTADSSGTEKQSDSTDDLYSGTDDGGDAGVAGLTKRQLENYTVAYNTAKEEGLTEKGILSVIVVVTTETKGWNYANDGSSSGLKPDQNPEELKKSMDHPESDGLPSDHGLGHGGDHGSVGIIQQQFPWWGTIDELMSRETATKKFIEKLVETDYENQTVGESVQSVQKSFDPSGSNYEREVPVAKAIIKKIEENE